MKHQQRRRTAGGLAVALMLTMAACGGTADEREAVRDSAGQAGSNTTTSIATSSTVAGTGPTTTVAGTRTTTTRSGATTTIAKPVSGPAALTPPAPGTYRYNTTGGLTFGGSTTPFPAVTTLVVDTPSGTTQRSVRDLRDTAGGGLLTEFTLNYRPDGVALVALRLTVVVSGITQGLEVRPPAPVLLLPTGAGPGGHYEYDLSGSTPTKLVVDILGEERVTIGGTAVDTLVVRAVVTIPAGDITGRQELTINVDKGSRLWVKERSVTDAAAAGGLITAHAEHTATLQRLTP